jgi:hypothetical protein
MDNTSFLRAREVIMDGHNESFWARQVRRRLRLKLPEQVNLAQGSLNIMYQTNGFHHFLPMPIN